MTEFGRDVSHSVGRAASWAADATTDGGAQKLADASPIVLAHEKPFRLGAASVRPAYRELVAPEGRRETLEPRVMQVLVALRRADGGIITRDELIQSCWEGRIVGEDAIDRVISRLRRLAESLGDDGFQIETITKVGYRLKPARIPVSLAGPDVAMRPSPGAHVARRWLVAGGVAAAALAAGGGLLWRGAHRGVVLDRATQTLYDGGWTALYNGLPEQVSQGVGLFRRVVEAEPEFADGWGALACAYEMQSRFGAPNAQRGFQERARAAAERARRIDPDNALATAALVSMAPLMGNWLKAERAYRAALRSHADATPLLNGLLDVLAAVGRCRESLAFSDRQIRLASPSPQTLYRRINSLWFAGRLEEADRTVNLAIDTFPRNVSVWFTSFLFYMRSGRPGRAIAMGLDVGSRPVGVPDHDFELVMAGAKAALSMLPGDIDDAMAMNVAAASQGLGYTENAILLGMLLDRLDAAFALAEAYYFDRQFNPERRSFSRVQGQFYRERRTFFLFSPLGVASRADPRFDALTSRLGLQAYWAQAGHGPDYKRA